MKYTRRDALAVGAGTAAAVMMPFRAFAEQDEAAIAAFTGGADVIEGGIELTAPEIAENGSTVPISVSADGASEIMVFATENPAPEVIKFIFGPRSGASSASTRCRLAGTQDLIAVAKMADGSFVRTSVNVRVTIGGCG